MVLYVENNLLLLLLLRMAPIVLHFDYDCFYASVVENEDPRLRELPLGIQQKNILVTCNYVARSKGIRKLQLVADAKRQCKDLVIVNGEDLTRFRDVSKKIWLFLRDYIWDHLTERLGFDEIFVNVTQMIDFNISNLTDSKDRELCFFRLSQTDPSAGFSFDAKSLAGHAYSPHDDVSIDFDNLTPLDKRLFLASHLASFLRSQVLLHFNHTCSAGISTTKLSAKLAGSVHKPNQQTVIFPAAVTRFLDGHEIGKIPGIGFKTAQKIRNAVLGKTPQDQNLDSAYGEEIPEKVTVGEVRNLLNLRKLEDILGGNSGQGKKIWGWLHGVDEALVSAAAIVPTQISIEDTFRPGKLTTLTELARILQQLITKLLQRMQTDLLEQGGEGEGEKGGRKWMTHPKNFRLSIRFHQKPSTNFSRISKSAPMPGYVFSLETAVDVLAERLVRNVAMGLFGKICPEGKKWELQLVNVAAVNMNDGGGGRDIGKMFGEAKKALSNDSEWQTYREVKIQEKQTKDKDDDESLPPRSLEEDDDDNNNDNDNDIGGFEDGTNCMICGVTFPVFALEAHQRFHEFEG